MVWNIRIYSNISIFYLFIFLGILKLDSDNKLNFITDRFDFIKIIKYSLYFYIFILFLYSIWSLSLNLYSTDLVNYYLPFGKDVFSGVNPYLDTYANSGPFLYILFSLSFFTPNPTIAIKIFIIFCFFFGMYLTFLISKRLYPLEIEQNIYLVYLSIVLYNSSFLLLIGSIRQYDDDTILTIIFLISYLVFLLDKDNIKMKSAIITGFLVPIKFFSGIVFILLIIFASIEIKDKIYSLIIYFLTIFACFIVIIIIWGSNVILGPICFSNEFGTPRGLSFSYFLQQIFGFSTSWLKLACLVIGIAIALSYFLVKIYYYIEFESGKVDILQNIITIAIFIICINLSQSFLTMWYLMWVMPFLSLIIPYFFLKKYSNLSLFMIFSFLGLNIITLIWYYAFIKNLLTPLLLSSIFGSLFLFILLFSLIYLELKPISNKS